MTTGGFWRLIWPVFSRNPGFSNWLIVDRRNHIEFRLTVEEQEAMSIFAEHSGAMMLSPEFSNLSFRTQMKTLLLNELGYFLGLHCAASE